MKYNCTTNMRDISFKPLRQLSFRTIISHAFPVTNMQFSSADPREPSGNTTGMFRGIFMPGIGELRIIMREAKKQ